MRLPFSKGNEHWGTVRRQWGEAPNSLGERKAFLIRSVESAFALLLSKVTKQRGQQTQTKRGVPIKRTISMMMGKGSINHNTRKFKAENIDAERSVLNSSYCNEPIEKVYHELFDEALERYNAKQKRNDRKIDNYYEKIRTGKQEKLFHEVVVQIGNFETMGSTTENGELAKQILDQYMKNFSERNPNLRVFSAHLHMDEATPHLHIDFIPFTTGSKRGLDTRVSLKQALATQGFLGESKGDTEWNRWVASEKEQLSILMKEYGIEWEQLGTHKEHLSVLNYKKEERSKEVEKLSKEMGSLNQKQLKIAEIENIPISKIPLSSKVTIEQKDYEKLSLAAKKHITQVKKENKLTKLLKAANETIGLLRKEIKELKTKLFSYTSIKGHLDVSSLKKENAELKKENTKLKIFIEEKGLESIIPKQIEEKNLSKNLQER